MKKILLIIQREYLSRVKKKSFLITTFLIPLAMSGITIGLAVMAAKSEQRQKILVWDESGVFLNKLDSNSASYKMVYTSQPQGDYKAMLEKEEADILLHIYPFVNGQPDSINLYKQGGLSLNAKDFISDELNAVYQVKLLQDAGMNKSKIDSINESQISPKSFDLDNNQETHTEISTMIGYATGFLIYLVILERIAESFHLDVVVGGFGIEIYIGIHVADFVS